MNIDILVKRAQLLADIRQFFALRKVMEVDVPVLGASTVTDPQLSSLSLSYQHKPYFLQTSPEFFMKRLLASGAGSIYYIGKAFRKEELGCLHNPEFTLLEWYQIGYDDHALMDEVVALIKSVKPELVAVKKSYQALFQSYVGVNPHTATVTELASLAREHVHVDFQDEEKNTWLDLLFTHLVEPNLGDQLTVIYDYPASQCALAKVRENEDQLLVAKRFEVYWRGIELANGYWELTDPEVQQQRFTQDIQLRKKLALPEVAIDKKFMLALTEGLPECAGVALGLDRLLMCLNNAKDIKHVMPFPFDAL